MSWTDLLQPASFRDRPFFVQSAQGEVGRAVVVHTYPSKDKAYVEDMGREPREITLECIVYGDNYMVARDALIEAFEQPGPGRLVHPYWGEMTVSVAGRARIVESADFGGTARITLSVVEAGDLVFPTANAATQALVNAKADAAVSAIESDFASVFDVSGTAGFVPAAAIDMIRNAAGALEDITSQVTTLPEPVSEFVSALGELSNAASNLIRAPQTLASTITALYQQIKMIVAQPKAALDMVKQTFGLGGSTRVPAATTLSRQQQVANQVALISFQHRTAVVEAVRISAALTFESQTEAVAVRDELIEQIDTLIETAEDAGTGVPVLEPVSDAVYFALVDLRAAMVTDIGERGGNLAQVRTLSLDETLPAVVLAYDLYGDAGRGDEIARRNKVSHPGFLPAGVDLEVLTDGE